MRYDDDDGRLFWIGFGGLAPMFAAMALVAVRGRMLNTNVALVLVAVVVAVAVAGGTEAGAVAAVVSALSFNFFHTEPYLQLRIDSADDVETTILLLVVGLVAGSVAAGGRRARSAADARRREIRRLHRVAELTAGGAAVEDVILAAEAELSGLLHLAECRFEASPFPAGLDRMERSGALPRRPLVLRREGFELPAAGISLEVLGRGRLLGRFALVPEAGSGVSPEERVVAVALADQVGAALAAEHAGGAVRG